MKHYLKNIFAGFFVSFVGSIPLGYLNVIGFELYNEFGFIKTCFYLLGVITIEFFVVFSTLLFAKKLMQNKKILHLIKFFSVIFMFVLSYFFFTSGNFSTIKELSFSAIITNFYLTGIAFSFFNFIQIPFWLSWNLYLLNGNFITFKKSSQFFYVFGTIIGTFFGMFAIIFLLSYFSNQSDFLDKYLIKFIIPIVFFCIGSFQAWKLYTELKRK